MRLSQLQEDSCPLAIEMGDDSLNIVYLPSGYTPELEDKFMASSEKNRAGGSLAEFLSGMLVKWDLQDDEGNVHPTDMDSLRHLPVKFLNSIVEAISEDMNPQKKTKGKNSAGTSLRKGA